MPRLKTSRQFFSNVDFRVMTATGQPVGRRRLVCVLLPLQVHSSLEPRQGIQEEGRFAPCAPGAIEWSPAPRDAPRARVVRSGAHHVRLSVPGSKILTAHGLGAHQGPLHPRGHRPAVHLGLHPGKKPGSRASRTSPLPGAFSYNPAPPAQEAPPPAASMRVKGGFLRQSPPSAPSPGRRGFRGQPPGTFVHSHSPFCLPPPFPDA